MLPWMAQRTVPSSRPTSHLSLSLRVMVCLVCGGQAVHSSCATRSPPLHNTRAIPRLLGPCSKTGRSTHFFPPVMHLECVCGLARCLRCCSCCQPVRTDPTPSKQRPPVKGEPPSQVRLTCTALNRLLAPRRLPRALSVSCETHTFRSYALPRSCARTYSLVMAFGASLDSYSSQPLTFSVAPRRFSPHLFAITHADL
jgi:hypothetical protein